MKISTDTDLSRKPKEPETLPNGIVFLAKRNRNDKFYVASDKNTFGGWPVTSVLIDSGCNSLLLPILESQLTELVDHFASSKGFLWSANVSMGVSGQEVTLCIVPKYEAFKISLCQNIQMEGNDFTVDTASLRFHLCKDDALELVRTESLLIQTNLKERSILEINNFIVTTTLSKRRLHALLGQSLPSDMYIYTVQIQGVMAGFKTKYFKNVDTDFVMDLSDFMKCTPGNSSDLVEEYLIGDDENIHVRDEFKEYI